MKSVETYVVDILRNIGPLPVKDTSLSAALGCVLAQDIYANEPVPRFANSAVDGFAFRHGDLSGKATLSMSNTSAALTVAGDIPAGDNKAHMCQPETAWRIMTGARIPKGADTVVKVEDTDHFPGIQELPKTVTVHQIPPLGANIRRAGEDCQIGDLILRRGDKLTPTALASAAAVGHATLPVRNQVRAAVISTGNELAKIGKPLKPAEIYDSNGVLIAGLLQRADVEVKHVTRVKDNPQDLVAAVNAVCSEVDLIITSGGISAGAYDVVKAALPQMGLDFSHVAMQPGRPQGFGQIRLGNHTVWLSALPGNPVAVFVSFHVFIRPLLAKLTGQTNPGYGVCLAAAMAHGWTSPPGKRQFVPVHINWTQRRHNLPIARPTHHLGARSHFVASLHEANGVAIVPEEITQVTDGDTLEVIVVEECG